MKNYTLFVKLQILCNIKAVSFAYPLENFTLYWIFYTTSGCDGCDKYQVCITPFQATRSFFWTPKTMLCLYDWKSTDDDNVGWNNDNQDGDYGDFDVDNDKNYKYLLRKKFQLLVKKRVRKWAWEDPPPPNSDN